MNDLNSDEKAKGCCVDGDAAATCCQPAAGSVSSCCAPGDVSWQKSKTLVSVVIIAAAIAVGAHSFVKGTSAQSQNTGPGKSFSAGLTEIPTTTSGVRDHGTLQPKPQEIPLNLLIDSLQALETQAVDKDVVFLVLPGEAQITSLAIPKQVGAVANNLWNSGQRVAVFTLRNGTSDHTQLARHFSIETFPSVIILGRQGSSSAVSGDVTEARLYNAFVLASKPVSCCPAQGNASCCPK